MVWTPFPRLRRKGGGQGFWLPLYDFATAPSSKVIAAGDACNIFAARPDMTNVTLETSSFVSSNL